MPKTIVGIGEILWDMIPGGRQLGGAPANFAYHTSALGGSNINSVVVSSIGQDNLGQEIQAKLQELELEQRYIHTTSAYPTGTVDVQLDNKGIPSYTINPDVAWDHIPPVGQELAAQADVVCFGSLAQRSTQSRASIQDFLGQTRPDCIKIFDINLRQQFYDKVSIQKSLELSNVLKINDEELPVVCKLLEYSEENPKVQIRLLEQQFELQFVVLTRGDKGSIISNSNDISEHLGHPVQLAPGENIDTVGAGDSFTATIALGILHQLSLDTMNEFANRVASFVCSKAGATPKLPDELKALFPQNL